MRVKIAYWIAGALLVACVAVWFVLLQPQSDETFDETLNADDQTDRERSTPSNPVHDGRVKAPRSISSNELDLLTSCPDPTIERLSESCLQSLDQFFSSKRIGWLVDVVGSSFERLEYQRIFASPLRDQSGVFATLDREECFLEDDERRDYWGPRSGRDLKMSCNAEAFTNYAQFGAICYGFREGRDAEREWIDPQLAVYASKTRFQHFLGGSEHSSKNDNAEVYERRRLWLWEEVLEVRWLKRQCAKFDSVPTMDGDRYAQEYERLKTLSIRLEQVSEWMWETRDPRVNIYEGLTKLASLLGDGRTREGYRLGKESWQELVYGVNLADDPWMGDLNDGWLGPTSDRGIRMFTGLNAARALEKRDIDYDLEWLVESVCRTSDYRGTDERGNKSCRWWVGHFRDFLAEGQVEIRDADGTEVNTTSKGSREEYLWALDRFEEVALELGIYD